MQEQAAEFEHRLLVVDTGNLGGRSQLPPESGAEGLAMLLRDGIESGAPHRVVDGAPDRLDVEMLAGEGLEFGAERRQPGQAVLERLRDRTRDRAAGGARQYSTLLPRRSPSALAAWP